MQQLGVHAAGALPHRIWIGVTGHRDLAEPDAVAAQVRLVLDRLAAMAGPDTPLGIVSPLAEGADRLVAREVLTRPGAVLELALPMRTDTYLEDFATPESRQEFLAMREQAALVTVMSAAGREDAYYEAGHYVVARSDVLVAVWDRQPAHGRGGTGDVVKLAEERGVPVVTITVDGTGIDWGGLTGVERREGVDHFNAQPLPSAAVTQRTERLRADLLTAATTAGFAASDLEPYVTWVVPHLVRADLLAARYQRWYRHAGSLLFLGSFVAVAVATVQALFRPEQVRLVWLEAAAMASLLVVLHLARRWKLHGRWLGYRSLAEQFRAGLFRAVAGMGQVRTETGSAVKEQPDAWVPRLFDELWMARPREPLPTDRVGDFVRAAWLEEQIGYNRASRDRNHRADVALRATVALLFAATLVVAVVHAAEINEGAHHWFELGSILLPAAAAAVHGLRSQRDYVRNAERAAQLLEGLEHLRDRLPPGAADKAQVQSVVAEASRLMLEENREWFGLMRHHELEIQV